MSPRRAKAVRGRVGDEPATALREHLIDVAERLLADRQVSTITTRDIARAANVSDGVLYNYFAGKNDLLLTALVRRFGRLVDTFDATVPEPGTGTVEQNLTALIGAMFELHVGALPMAAGLLSEPPLLRRFFETIHQEPFNPQRYPHRIAEYLVAERRLGRLAGVDVEATVTLLIGAALLLALTGVIGSQGRAEIDATLPGVVATLVRGLDLPPAAGTVAASPTPHPPTSVPEDGG